jgi:signal transduction histidine kinase
VNKLRVRWQGPGVSYDRERLVELCAPKSLLGALVVAFVLMVVPAYVPVVKSAGGFRAPWVVFGLCCAAVPWSYLFYRARGRGRFASLFTLADTFFSQLALSVGVASTNEPWSFAYAALQGYVIVGVYARYYACSASFAVVLGVATVGVVGALDGLGNHLFIVSCAYVFGLWVMSATAAERRERAKNARLQEALAAAHAIAARGVDLALAKAAVSAGTLMHELRNDLSVVGTNLAYLEMSGLTVDAEEAVNDARQGFERAQTRLGDFVAKTRQHAAKLAEPFEPGEVARALARDHGDMVEIHVDSVQGEFSMPGGAEELKLVLSNLVRNAAQAGATQVKLRLYLGDGGLSAFIDVVDNGRGVSPELVQSAGMPFVSTRQDVGGTGLGLYLCRRQVELLGGTLDVESEQGGGTLVRIRLPANATGPSAGVPSRMSEVAHV